jgi:hypothetical protein
MACMINPAIDKEDAVKIIAIVRGSLDIHITFQASLSHLIKSAKLTSKTPTERDALTKIKKMIIKKKRR